MEWAEEAGRPTLLRTETEIADILARVRCRSCERLGSYVRQNWNLILCPACQRSFESLHPQFPHGVQF
jgi:Zn finger protein HypA/HybF involved in hydrogenase expression